ncbi:hypothetical protein [Brucella intermedia]|uniref:hypothetical protein n=1 Tax=Brucella intermedia TaxID=94625 RepID=UPI0023622197|nr:hypothetical protein [Brucella intermedia]
MPDKARPSEAEIRYAIEYALRSETVTAEVADECGGTQEETVNITVSDIEPFTMRLLQALTASLPPFGSDVLRPPPCLISARACSTD